MGPLLYAAAALFTVFEWVCLARWLQVPDPAAHAWSSLTADPFVFMAWTDMAVFTALVLVWLWKDLKTSQKSKLYFVATLLTGCPALLVYLARTRPVIPTPSAPRSAP
jgi:hypothetical protein